MIDPLEIARSALARDGAAADAAESADGGAAVDPILSAPSMAAVRELGRRVAARPGLPLLVRGDPGTGAEETARYVHELGGGGELFAVRCHGVSEEILYADLCGAASGGAPLRPRTLFIDDVAHLGPAAQEHLLSLLMRGGPPAVRVIAATSIDLARSVQDRAFRADLLHRLSIVEIRLPRLRDRADDVVPLAELFLRASQRADRPGPAALSPAARVKLANHPWPGNCRELRAVVERATVLDPGPIIGAAAIVFTEEPLPALGRAASLADAFSTAASERGAPLTMREIERQYIVWLLGETRGNRTAAARILGISYPTMQKKILDYGITVKDSPPPRARPGE